VALALGHKGVEVEWLDVDPRDRGEVERVSGQRLVPVLVAGERVITDSTTIIRFLERQHPEPSLWPPGDARIAELDVFLDWFDRVWKRPPNVIYLEREGGSSDPERVARLGRAMTGLLDLFERLLAGRDYLWGDFSAADCAAFPFLRYAVDRNEADDEPFHAILREFMPLGDAHPKLRAWIDRVDRHPRA
jgi:glutathione S-transferase